MSTQQYHLESIDGVTCIVPVEMVLRIPTLQILARFPTSETDSQCLVEEQLINQTNQQQTPLIIHIRVPMTGYILNAILIHLKQSIVYEAAEIKEEETPVFAVDENSLVELVEGFIYFGL